MAEIKPNSNVYKEKQEDAKKNTKPTAKTKLREKTFKEKLRDAFIADDVVDIKDYLIFKLAIPNIKKMLRNMMVGAIDMKFFGKNMGSQSDNSRSGATIVDYSKAYRSGSLEREYDTPRSPKNNSVSVRDIDLVRFEKEDEAVSTLRWLRSAIDDYGVATVSDFLDISGLQANNVHRKWGWFNLSSASVKCDPDCDLYYIDFPPPKPINGL